MKAVIINDINVNFKVSDERVFISSLELGQVFEKRHDSVLRVINKLPNDEFKNQNFAKHSYIDKTGRVLPCYNLTRDGFSLLVMGFTGEKAYKWKVEFIKAFNIMEAELQALKFKHHQSQINGYKSQIAQRNKQILRLKHRLCVAEIRMSEIYDAEVIDDSQIGKESLRALLHNARLERDYYFKKANELKQKQKFKDSEITRALNNIQIQMDGVFKEIDVAMRYTNDDDYYLQITK
ncbi:Rha family transcriptional regulator [Campylobacter sp. faydin G-140]|uniref:Rha family transcriptional regulator n=1 Tax=Campylobacter anatolicus TaxID=2829105 RepID=UPI001B906DA4|nr:Rha family transcriptional regulator [Campylobacter anatolicus]MBR8461514.1 Rha family transcriptional regulator [Campylobacter anatolicus]MBR8466218.1 Rha family transcriptional regulator [Campylobacter anatolicus]